MASLRRTEGESRVLFTAMAFRMQRHGKGLERGRITGRVSGFIFLQPEGCAPMAGWQWPGAVGLHPVFEVTGQSRRVGRAVLCAPPRAHNDAPACRGLPALPRPAMTEALLFETYLHFGPACGVLRG